MIRPGIAVWAVCLLAAAPGPLPDTPAGRQFAAWLAAFNQGQPAAYGQFLQRNFPSRAKDLDRDVGFRSQTGGFDFRKVEESQLLRLTGLVQERDSDQFARFSLEVEPQPPYRIVRLDLRAIPRPPDFPIPAVDRVSTSDGSAGEIESGDCGGSFCGSRPDNEERPDGV